MDAKHKMQNAHVHAQTKQIKQQQQKKIWVQAKFNLAPGARKTFIGRLFKWGQVFT